MKNLTNLLDYANSIYDFNKKINSILRKNKKCNTKPATALKIIVMGLFTKAKSINAIQNGIFSSVRKRYNNIFSKNEFIPKTHALRDCINDIDWNDVKEIHKGILNKLKSNKFFENNKYRNTGVAIVDGVETFETKKEIKELHVRKHTNGEKGYYYKALGIMYLADNVDIMLDMVPFEKNEVKEDTEHNEKVKSEGEITVFKKIVSKLKEFLIEVTLTDCMFCNAPCFNEAKKNGIDIISKLTDEKREIYKDAEGLFKLEKCKKSYEIVEVIENKRIEYSKESKKKNSQKTEKYTYIREISNKEINKKEIVEDKITKHPKKKVHFKKTEKILKKVRIWSDEFEMAKYEYGKVRIIKVEEDTKEKEKKVTKEMYIVTTLMKEDLEFIADLMHRRWDIELKGFRKLKSRYNIDHLYIGTKNAINLIIYLTMIVYNFIELYFNIHTKKYRRSICYDSLLEDYKIEVAITKDMYKYFLLSG